MNLIEQYKLSYINIIDKIDRKNRTITKDLTSESQKESIKGEAEKVLRKIMSENPEFS